MEPHVLRFPHSHLCRGQRGSRRFPCLCRALCPTPHPPHPTPAVGPQTRQQDHNPGSSCPGHSSGSSAGSSPSRCPGTERDCNGASSSPGCGAAALNSASSLLQGLTHTIGARCTQRYLQLAHGLSTALMNGNSLCERRRSMELTLSGRARLQLIPTQNPLSVTLYFVFRVLSSSPILSCASFRTNSLQSC